MSPDVPTPEVPATADVPLLAGRYQVLEKLGAGGMGTVFRARDVKLDRLVALKMLPEGSTPDPDAVARFRREAKALARLTHPGIRVLVLRYTTVYNPFTTRAAINRLTDNPATAYFNRDGSYVVVDNVTSDMIQISNRLDPNWIPDSYIVNPFRP
jgi:serine/threonine protein kinase